MKYNINLNQEKMIEWELSFPEAILSDLFSHLQSWADSEIIDGEVWYFFSKNKILDEAPILSKSGKIDTVYRQLKGLISKSLIEYKKVGYKDYWRITELLKEWNFNNSEKNPNNSENYPKLSEKNPNNSENYPTYNNTNILTLNNNTNIHKPQKKFEGDSFEYYISKYFLNYHIEENTPSIIYLLKSKDKEKILQNWSKVISKLKKLDGFSEKEIDFIIKFTLDDDFWKHQILSIEKFRKKKDGVSYFVKMIDKAKQEKDTNLKLNPNLGVL